MRAPAWMRQEDSGRAGSTESFSVDEDCPAKARKILGSDAALGQLFLFGQFTRSSFKSKGVTDELERTIHAVEETLHGAPGDWDGTVRTSSPSTLFVTWDKILSARKARKSGAKRRPRRVFSSLEIVQETSSVEHSGGGWLPGWFSRRERVKQQETKAGPSVDSTATLRSEAATLAEIETDRGVMVTGTLGYCR
jgi:hypothetical protein